MKVNRLIDKQLKEGFLLDEETLNTVAQRTGGTYYKATDKQALTEIFQTIATLIRPLS